MKEKKENFKSITSNNLLLIECLTKIDVYCGVFSVLKILDSKIEIDKYISYFHENHSKKPLNNQLSNPENSESFQKNIIKKFFKKNIFASFCCCVILTISISLMVIRYRLQLDEAPFLGSNFSIPHQEVLLKRPNVIGEIIKSLNVEEAIKYAVLIGAGGSGKTTVARSYAIGDKSSIIWEVNAENKSTLMNSFEQLAYVLSDNSDRLNELLKIQNIESRETMLMSFIAQQLKEKSNWLIIYDNVDSFKGIQVYFPRNFKVWGSGKVIITTRDSTVKNNNFIGGNSMIEVAELSKEEKLDLFLKITKDNKASKEEIASFLDQIPSFPLDVSLTAYYLKEKKISYDRYLRETRDLDKKFILSKQSIAESIDDYSKNRYGIISISVNKIIEKNNDFRDLLFLVSLLNSQEIPRKLLENYKGEELVKEFIGEMKKNYLINTQCVDETNKKDSLNLFSIHRNIQAMIFHNIKTSIDFSVRKNIFNSIFSSLNSYLFSLAETENSIQLKAIENHLRALLNKEDEIFNEEAKLKIRSDLGIISYYLGYDINAKNSLEENLQKLKSYDNNQSIDLAWILLHLGAIYRKLGNNYNQAIYSLEKSIDIYRQKPSSGIGLAMALTHLGNTYRTIGNFEKAKISLQEAVNIFEANTNIYASTAKALSYLGVVYREQKDYEKAEVLFKKSILLYDSNNHPKYSSNYAATIAHFGVLCRMMGKYKESEELLLKSLEIYKKIRPEKHPDKGKNILNLGIIYGEMTEYKKSLILLKQSLREYEENYGRKHIETGKVLNNLARVYILSKEFNNAEIALERALSILQNNNHPEAYRSFELLGDMFIKIGTDNDKEQRKKAIDCYNNAIRAASKFFNSKSSIFPALYKKIESIDCSG